MNQTNLVELLATLTIAIAAECEGDQAEDTLSRIGERLRVDASRSHAAASRAVLFELADAITCEEDGSPLKPLGTTR